MSLWKNRIKRYLYFSAKLFQIHTYREISKSSREVHIMKNLCIDFLKISLKFHFCHECFKMNLCVQCKSFIYFI